MKDVFISIRGRIQVNAEALNMVESVGNYVKHRRIPIVHYKDGEYLSLYVPAVSGESLAHGYQETLSHIAQEMNLPVCKYCKQGIFLKSTNSKVYKASFNAQDVPKNDSELEKSIIKGCVVEDVGGFLFAEGGRSIKRTSNFYVGYMIPVREALEASLLESQLHTRYALGTEFVKEQGGQMIYYVELASAVYGFSFDLDTSYIGRSSFTTTESGGLVVESREAEKRKEAALIALKEFLMEMKFGAKKTRYLPMHDWESIVVAISDKVWTVPSPLVKSYIQRAKQKLKNVNYNTKLYTYSEEEGESFEEVLSKAFEDALNRIKS